MYRLLIADDEKNERDCLRYLIEEAGLPVEIREAENGADALEVLESWSADLLLTDIQMPVMNGLDLIRTLSERESGVRVVIFSSYAEFEYARTALHYGVENYILKPVVPEELETTLRSLLDQLEEERTADRRRKSSMLQYALQCAIYGSFTPEAFEPGMADRLQEFRRMVLLDFPGSYLEKNYARLCESLTSRLGLDFVALNLSPQALLLLREDIPDEQSFGVRLLEHVRSISGLGCYAAFSEPLNRYDSLRDAFSFTEQRMEQRFWNPSERVFLSRGGGWEAAITQAPDDDTLLTLIKSALSARDEQKFTQGLEMFVGKYSRGGEQSHIYVKFQFSNLVAALYPALPEEQKKSGPPMEQIISELYLQRDIAGVIETVQRLAQPVAASLRESSTGVRRELLIVQDYIHAHYDQELSVELLASIVFLSPDYLSRLFKKSTGKSLYQYIRQFRMEKASHLLRETTKKVIDIGTETGYPNYSYFCQSFREYFGKSPERYRQEGSDA
ncbi:MAG: response regulator [Oscillospiraceae bacterium]|nr:response regulator [Oscillospiraceae bacterium]